MVDCKKLVNLGPPFRRDNIGAFSLAATLFVLLLLPLAAEAQVPTTTTLTVNPIPAMVGQVVTLTATVTSNGEPVAVGTLTFLSGKQVLATVQVVQASGTATLKTRFAPGMFELNAQYNANNLFQAEPIGAATAHRHRHGAEPHHADRAT